MWMLMGSNVCSVEGPGPDDLWGITWSITALGELGFDTHTSDKAFKIKL